MSPKPGGCHGTTGRASGGLPRYSSPAATKIDKAHRFRSPGFALRDDLRGVKPPPSCSQPGRGGYSGDLSRRPVSPLSPHGTDEPHQYKPRLVRGGSRDARGLRAASPQCSSLAPAAELAHRSGFARKLRGTDSPTRTAMGYPSPAPTSTDLRTRCMHRQVTSPSHASPISTRTPSRQKAGLPRGHTPHRRGGEKPLVRDAAAACFPATPTECAAASPVTHAAPVLSPRPGEEVVRRKIDLEPEGGDENDDQGTITQEMRFAALDAFSFGDAPSESDAERLAAAPVLGTSIKAPKASADSAGGSAQDVMARFAVLCDAVAANAAKPDGNPEHDLLPHVTATDIVKQVVRRINGFTDTGAARAVRNYRPVFAAFLRVVNTLFRAVGKNVRASAMVDLLGCLFDMKLSLDYCAPWVAEPELDSLVKVVMKGADPAVSFGALLMMIRQQCSFLGTEHGIDMSAVGVCIGELIPLAAAAAQHYKAETHVLFKELHRFTDAHDSVWTGMKQHYSLDDDPMRPSPLGALHAVVRAIVEAAGVTRAQSGMTCLGVSRGCRLQQVLDMVCAQYPSEADTDQSD